MVLDLEAVLCDPEQWLPSRKIATPHWLSHPIVTESWTKSATTHHPYAPHPQAYNFTFSNSIYNIYVYVCMYVFIYAALGGGGARIYLNMNIIQT